MQTAKKASITFDPVPNLRAELEYLYARRSAVEALIRSLEDYERFKDQQAENAKRQTA